MRHIQPFAIATAKVSSPVGLTAIGQTLLDGALPAADSSLMSIVIEPSSAHVVVGEHHNSSCML
ncbi:hypothetical protein FOXYSP1_02557 [Fusarium oxysporum f. sp. phaseoli]